MSKITIMTDSTAYIPDDLVTRYDISVVPQVLIWGDETFRDGVDIQPDAFYQRLKTARVMPSTSQVTPAILKEAFEKELDKGNQVLGIFISSKLSGTCQSATQALDMIPGSQDRVHFVDSDTTAMAMGFHVLAAARAAEAGATLDECRKVAEEARKHSGVLFIVDTLEFLHRGGRIGGAARWVGTALNFKPILELKDGRIESLEKVRTKGKAIARLMELLTERLGSKSNIRIAALHANAEQEARNLLDLVTRQFKPVETVFSAVSPVVGTHAGPGTLGIAYMAGGD